MNDREESGTEKFLGKNIDHYIHIGHVNVVSILQKYSETRVLSFLFSHIDETGLFMLILG